MKKPDNMSEEQFEAIREFIASQPNPKVFDMSRLLFEDKLAEHIRFWRSIGQPDKEKLTRIMVWDEFHRNKGVTAQIFGLTSPESVRKMLDKFWLNYRKNTHPKPPTS